MERKDFVICNNLSLHLGRNSRIDLVIPEHPSYAADEIEVWFVCDDSKICVFKDSWGYTLLTEVFHVVNRFRDHNQRNHYPPEELTSRYFRHLAAHKPDNALWDYLLFSYECNHIFLAENRDGEAVLVFSVMSPYGEHPECKQLESVVLDRALFLRWFDKLIEEIEVIISKETQ